MATKLLCTRGCSWISDPPFSISHELVLQVYGNIPSLCGTWDFVHIRQALHQLSYILSLCHIFFKKKNERKTVYERWKNIYSEQSRRTDFWQIWLSISAFESSLWVRQHTKTLPLTIRSKINLVHHTVFKIWYRREPSQSWIHCAAGPNKCCSLHEFFHGSCVFPHTCT